MIFSFSSAREHTLPAIVMGLCLVLFATSPAADDNNERAGAPDEEEETSARFDLTSDVLIDPGAYVLGMGLTAASQRNLVEVTEADPAGTGTRVRTIEEMQYVTQLRAIGLYSVTRRFDVFASLSGQNMTNQSGIDTTAGGTTSDSGFGQFVLGGRFQFAEEGRSPGVRLRANVTVAEDNAEREYLTGSRISLETHRNVDPVNLRLRLQYQHAQPRDVETGDVVVELDPADELGLFGEADFVVNDRVIIVGGFGVAWSERSVIDGESIETTRFQTPFQLGLRYGVTPETNFEARLRMRPQTEYTGVEFTLSSRY